MLCFSSSNLSTTVSLSFCSSQAPALFESISVFFHLHPTTRFQNPFHAYRPNICSFGEMPRDPVIMSNTPSETGVTVVTFNMLAPCYKRQFAADGSERRDREGDNDYLWKSRFDSILNMLVTLSPMPDVICLQEVWFYPSYISRLESILAPLYYIFYAQRPGKPDGLATLIHRHSPNVRAPTCGDVFVLDRSGDRVALPINATTGIQSSSPLLIINTHLTFPHCLRDSIRRKRQASTLATYVDDRISATMDGQHLQVILSGDFNSDNDSPVATLLHKAQFINSYNVIHGNAAQPKTHCNHRRQSVYVDHVFFRAGPGFPDASTISRARKGLNSLEMLTPPSVQEDENATLRVNTKSRRRNSVHGVTQAEFDHDTTSDDTDVDMDGEIGHERSEPSSPFNVSSRAHCALMPSFAQVLPKSLNTDVWPIATEYSVSDHRPVMVSFDYTLSN